MPAGFHFGDPGCVGLGSGRNLRLSTEPGVEVGVWHILPGGGAEESEAAGHEQQLREGENTVVLYLHGNSAHRAGAHRVELYQLLRTIGYQVCLTFDLSWWTGSLL